MTKYTIESASKLTNDQLHQLMGHNAQIEDFRRVLADAKDLEGDKREKFEADLTRTLSPTIYTGGLSYDLERARKSDIADTCGCCPVSDRL